MKVVFVFLVFNFLASFAFATQPNEVFKFKSKIGFTNKEDKIVDYRFLDNETKVLLIGERYLQVWEIEKAKMLFSVEHQIPQFAPQGFANTYFLLGLPKLLDWRPFLVDEKGRWIITSEKSGNSKTRSAIVRELPSLKQIAVLETSDVSVEYISHLEPKNEILTFGITDKRAAIASWDYERLTKKESIFVEEYKWHQTILDGKKLLVGSGDTKFSWSALYGKQGDKLTLRDAKTGGIEKEYTAKNLKPDTTFRNTMVSADEKYLISTRDNRIFVWEIDGNGQPKFEISNPNPKGEFEFENIIAHRFIVVEIEKELRIYDVFGEGKPIFAVAPQNEKEKLNFADFVGGRFVVIRTGNKIRVYDINGGPDSKFEVAPADPQDTSEYCGANSDGKFFAVKDDQRTAVYEFSGKNIPLYEVRRESEKERFRTVKFIKDKNLLAIARVNNAEKKEPRTEFYEVSTGKIAFEAPFAVSDELKITLDEKYFYESGLGWFMVWNKSNQKVTAISLKTNTPLRDNHEDEYSTNEEQHNVEGIEFSPNYRYALRYGGDVTAVFDLELGQEVQKLFDLERAKYDKNKNLKKSGLGKAGWTKNGKYVFAFDQSGFLDKGRTLSFWQLSN